MKIRKFIMKALVLVLVVTLAAVNSAAAAFASDSTDMMPELPGGPYSLEITIQSSNPDGSSTRIKGAEISVYQVADLTVKHGAAYYKAVSGFAEAGVIFDGMTAEESNAAAEEFAKIVEKKGVAGMHGRSGAAGEVDFSDLEPGVFLVKFDRYSSSDSRYTAMAPFLVLVPGIDKTGTGNAWISNVRVIPKIAIDPADHIEVDPFVIKKVKGDPHKSETFTFELKADDLTNPMPAGSSDGRKQSMVTGEGKTGFGTWTYTEPGTYRYTVREITGSSRNCKYDKTVYHLTDNVYYVGSKLRVDHKLTDENGKEYTKAEFTFVNEYTESGIVPQTGEDMDLLIWLVCAVSGTGIMIFSLKRRRCDG